MNSWVAATRLEGFLSLWAGAWRSGAFRKAGVRQIGACLMFGSQYARYGERINQGVLNLPNTQTL